LWIGQWIVFAATKCLVDDHDGCQARCGGSSSSGSGSGSGSGFDSEFWFDSELPTFGRRQSEQWTHAAHIVRKRGRPDHLLRERPSAERVERVVGIEDGDKCELRRASTW
jgi:hypothetical protein